MNYVLDYSRWRSGGEGKHRVGEGTTHMLNKLGYSCCLGQMAQQLGVSDDDLLFQTNPRDVSNHVGRYDPGLVMNDEFQRLTSFANRMMGANDDEHATPAERIRRIRYLLEKHGHTLQVINAPASVVKALEAAGP